MQPPCYVIVLESNMDSRRAYKTMARTMKSQGWSWQIFPAVVGRDLTEQDWDDIGIEMREDLGKMHRRPGAQGCWHSHFRLWNLCRQSGKSMIIMEEDCLALGPWQAEITDSDHVVKLFADRGTKENPITGRWGRGAFAYWLTAEHSDRLITHAQQHGAQALDKHLGDRVVPWQHWKQPMIKLNTRRGPSTTSPIRR